MGKPRLSSFLSVDLSLSLLEDNQHEMFSGATSEVIPSSISSFHYPHRFNLRRSTDNFLREDSPLLRPANDSGLTAVRSNTSAVLPDAASDNFRFFTTDEIEAAPGGSTLENPEDPIDYNTDWDYSVDKYGPDIDDGETEGALGQSFSSRFYEQPGVSRAFPGERMPPSPEQYHDEDEDDDRDQDYRSKLEDRYRRRSTASFTESALSAGLASEHLGVDELAFLQEFQPRQKQQRFYLAEEDIVIGIAGYVDCWWKKLVYYVLIACTCGVIYLVLRWLPKYRINLMGTPCALGVADWCVIENEYGELATVLVTRTRFGERLSSFFTISPRGKDDQDEEVLADAVKGGNPYRYLKFFYHPLEDIFKTNSNWYDRHWLKVKNLREGMSQALHEQRSVVFGKNSIDIEQKSSLQLLVGEVLHPFYAFQVFSILLWLAENYYYYAGCIFLISFASIVESLLETKSTIARLTAMSLFSCDVRVWWNEFWTQADSKSLVPGDVFEIDPSLALAPCDAVLINGECVVSESMLTGESVPVSKTAATRETVQYLAESITHPVLAKSFLYNGTKILKTKLSNDEPVMGMVVKTGFSTIKGSLVRSMLFPKPTGFKFYQDSFKYIGFMAAIGFTGFLYSTYNFIKLGLLTRIIVLRALDIITIVVPPALPATLTIGTAIAINRLKINRIFCIAPTRVNVGGKVDVMCFDKTGTLTEDGLDILGGRKEIVFGDLLPTVADLNRSGSYSTHSGIQLLGCMSSCHSLQLIDDALVGDPLDVKMVEFTGWHFLEEFGGLSVPLVFERVGTETEGYKILRKYEFVAALRRMSVLVMKDHTRHIFTKGAPEVIAEICDPTTIPADFEELLHKYTHGGLRVIACASRPLHARKDVKNMDRSEAERDLQFAGFIIFENKLKKSTKTSLAELRVAEIRTIMCTGDNVLTAISVGQDSELIDPLVLQVFIPRFATDLELPRTGDTGLVWEEMRNPDNCLDPVTLQKVSADICDNMHDHIFAVTGDVFRYILVDLKDKRLIETMLMKCNIFARMSPDEKQELVKQLQKIDYTVGFCGDGANDCGALKSADLGISLSKGEASVAAPFTSQCFEILCVLHVIREGRSSLVTSFSCFKYMSLYSAIQFVTVTILYQRGTNLGDFQFLYIDLFLILPLAIFMSWSKPYNRLVVKRPTANLVSLKVLVPLVCHIGVILMFQVAVWLYVQSQPWYMRPVPSNGNSSVESTDNTALFLFSNFHTGPPYREPIGKNKPFLINVVVAVAMSESWMGDFMELTNMSRTAYYLSWKGEQRIMQRDRRSKKKFKNLRAAQITV
ncbi:hypothetical protein METBISCDRAFT_29334 [Metschnikowia bicuspidata]|uniref:Cation-transporting ATPase n=1 Tax=Metschnikowia bicuspidata TaxID=27322 RepID=A0A4V1J3N9_9ASCO|nr:hypothetical protein METBISCDRAFT_29334 [Metschnikowia bicuspidata]